MDTVSAECNGGSVIRKHTAEVITWANQPVFIMCATYKPRGYGKRFKRMRSVKGDEMLYSGHMEFPRPMSCHLRREHVSVSLLVATTSGTCVEVLGIDKCCFNNTTV